MTTDSDSIVQGIARQLVGALGDSDGPGVPGVSDADFESAGESNKYGPWIALLKYCIMASMDSVISFYRQSNLTPSQRQICIEMVEVGRKQLAAPCANRIERLLQLEKMINALEAYKEDGNVTLPAVDGKKDDDEDALLVTPELIAIRNRVRLLKIGQRRPELAELIGMKQPDDFDPAEKTEADGKDAITALIDAKIMTIELEMEVLDIKLRDEQRRGVDVDFSRMKMLFRKAGSSGLSGSQFEEVLQVMPPGLRWAVEYGMSTGLNTDFIHQEAIVGKVVATGQRSPMSRNRPRRRRRHDDDYYQPDDRW